MAVGEKNRVSQPAQPAASSPVGDADGIGKKESGHMGIGDKTRHQFQDLTGKAKEATGRARRDRPLEREGQRQQKLSRFKKAGEQLKHAFRK